MDEDGKRDAIAELRKQVATKLSSEAGLVVDARVLAERERCAGLIALSEQAARIGVRFDADAAMRSRISLDTARYKVLNAAAKRDTEETSTFHLGRTGGSATAEDKTAMWRKAHENNRPKPAEHPKF